MSYTKMLKELLTNDVFLWNKISCDVFYSFIYVPDPPEQKKDDDEYERTWLLLDDEDVDDVDLTQIDWS